ncbi:hypothetical protein Leryth_017675 [Lithospermum erythrorhizon]|nr:hypothetical protein Leryth_017675 [Lithospermum erythrorhizon]
MDLGCIDLGCIENESNLRLKIKKATKCKSSPINWFPRKKVDSYLKRKIQHLQASFETAFEVDKQVAAAVKSAFMKLETCPSIDKDD